MSVYTRISNFYNATSDAWIMVWGDHCHHGYFTSYNSDITPYMSQVILMDKLLLFGNINSPNNILDVGCGVGGGTKYLSNKFSNSNVIGINISDRQLQIANDISKTNNNSFINCNAMNTTFDDEYFDLIWSLESAEHMPNHKKWLNECYRILNNNGDLLIGTWICKNENTLNSLDKWILYFIDKYFNSSLNWISIDKYKLYMNNIGYKDIKTQNWTKNVSIFWIYVIKSVFTRKGLYQMFCKGNSYLWMSMISVIFMWIGFWFGTIKYCVIYGKK